MKATDLQIRNKVQLQDGWVMTVSGIQTNHPVHGELIETDSEHLYGIDLLQGIPLADAWVEKLGYESMQEMICDLDELEFAFTGVYIDRDLEQWLPFFQKMSVHELQNYWKANTGEELTIKEEA